MKNKGFRNFQVILLKLLTISLIGCSSSDIENDLVRNEIIYSREEQLENGKTVRWPLYQVSTPVTWQLLPIENDLTDTTKPNATFLIDEGVTLSIHTFSYPGVEGHIPCERQIERWKGQLNKAAILVTPTSFCGFAGLYFEAENETTQVLGWSLQLDIRHRQKLFELAITPDQMAFFRQITSDCTLKVKGAPVTINDHKEEILSFANSLRLLHNLH